MPTRITARSSAYRGGGGRRHLGVGLSVGGHKVLDVDEVLLSGSRVIDPDAEQDPWEPGDEPPAYEETTQDEALFGEPETARPGGSGPARALPPLPAGHVRRR